MATHIDPKELDLQEQMARIRQMVADSDQRYEEMKRITGQIDLNRIEEKRIEAEIDQRTAQTKLEFPKFLVGSIIAAMGAGTAIGGLIVGLLAK